MNQSPSLMLTDSKFDILILKLQVGNGKSGFQTLKLQVWNF